MVTLTRPPFVEFEKLPGSRGNCGQTRLWPVAGSIRDCDAGHGARRCPTPPEINVFRLPEGRAPNAAAGASRPPDFNTRPRTG